MAITQPAAACDLVSLEEAAALLRETPHPVSVTTIRRWITRRGIPTERRGRGVVHVSFSDILVAHRDAYRPATR